MASFDVADSSPPPCSCLQRSCFKRQNPKISSRRRRIAPAIASNGHLFAVDVNSSSAIRTTRQPGRPISQRTNLRPADQVQKEEEMRPGCDMVVSAATCFFFSCCVARQKLCPSHGDSISIRATSSSTAVVINRPEEHAAIQPLYYRLMIRSKPDDRIKTRSNCQ